MGKAETSDTSQRTAAEAMVFERFPASRKPQVVFILDITGSMSSQITAVKGMVSSFCAVPRPDIDIHVWTYTESSKGCYITRSPPTSDHVELKRYVDSINLCGPPGMPGVSASGDDGPENLLAALATLLLSFDSAHNVVAFIITDALPHFKSDRSQTAQVERRWLTERGFSDSDNGHDAYVLLNKVVSSLNITMVPVLYHNDNVHWFAQVAHITEGITMSPQSGDSAQLRDGLVAVLEALNSIAITRTVDPAAAANLAQQCRGFRIRFNAPEFQILTEEPAEGRGSHAAAFDSETMGAFATRPEEVLEGLTGLLHAACDRFAGKRASKRVRSVKAEIVAASIRTFTWTVLHLIGSRQDADGAKWTAAVDALKNQLGIGATASSAVAAKPDLEADRMAVQKWFNELNSIRDLADRRVRSLFRSAGAGTGARDAEAATATPTFATVDGIVCAVSLDSVADVLEQLDAEVPADSEEGLKSWMDVVLRSTMCRLVNVVFPLDATGSPDFFDAWSSTVRGFSLSTSLSTAAAVGLRDSERGVYNDPLTRVDHSAAVIVAHPDDPVMTTAYRVLSALPSLMGMLQGYLASGGFKVFPSLAPGLQAATLLRLVQTLPPSRAPTDAEWELARILVHSLRSFSGSVAADAARDLKSKGHFNPADAPSKFLAAALRNMSPAAGAGDTPAGAGEAVPWETIAHLFDELAGDTINFIRRKRSYAAEPGATSTFVSDMPTETEIAHALMPLDAKAEKFNPVEAYHPIELLCMPKSAPGAAVVAAEAAIPSEAVERFQQQVLRNTEVFKQLAHSFRHLCSLFDAPLAAKESSSVSWGAACPLSEDEMVRRFYEALVLGKRTMRFDLLDPPEACNWVLVSREIVKERIDTAARDLIETAYQKQLTQWNAQRIKIATEQLIKQVVALPGSDTFDQSTAKLKEIKFTILDRTHRLQRKQVLDIAPLLSAGQRDSVLLALILGDWTSSPPAELRRSFVELEKYFVDASEEIVARIKTALNAKLICQRPVPNRHGHTKDVVYPGFNNWTSEYEAQRLANAKGGAGVVQRLAAMKARSEEIAAVHREIDDPASSLGRNRKKLLKIMVQISDVTSDKGWVGNMHRRIAALTAADQEERNEPVDAIVIRLSRTARHAPRKLAEFLKKL